MVILGIALPVPLNHLFDYLAPSGDHRLEIGMRVKVPFGSRTQVGILVEVRDIPQVERGKLKRAYEILDETPILSAHQFKLGLWAATYYACPIGEALLQLLPPTLRKGQTAKVDQKKHWKLTSVGQFVDETQFKRSPKQGAAWHLLNEHLNGLCQETIVGLGISTHSLNGLHKKGWATHFNQSLAVKDSTPPETWLKDSPLKLNQAQANCVQNIKQQTGFQVQLIHGVTGSGKTEVYLQLIEHQLNLGKQALVLVPEIGLTPQTLARFEARFTCPILNFHSQLTEKQRLKHWIQSKSTKPCVGIGTRSAIWAPFLNLGLIIVDEEHDASFKQQEGFLYSARDLAVYRGKLLDIPVVMGSATPSLESWHNAQQQRYQLHQLKERAGAAKAPKKFLENMSNTPKKFGLSKGLLKKITQHLERGEQCLLFLNRRGYAPTLYCNDCGWIAQCNRCDARLTYHKGTKSLRCHHCDSKQDVPIQCANCCSEDLTTQGQGTEKLEDQLASYIKPYPLIRIDKDTTSTKDAFVNQLEPVRKGEPCLLVGTQMISKGHHFESVTLVVVVNIDAGLFSCDFRASERLVQLLTQVAGRCGRGSLPGEVWVQTHHPNHPLLQGWAQQDYPALANHLLTERKGASLPPYAHMVLIKAEAMYKNISLGFLNQVSHLIHTKLSTQDPVIILGPAPAPMERKKGQIRMQLLLQSGNRKALHQQVHELLKAIPELKSSRKVRWAIDVDPQDLY